MSGRVFPVTITQPAPGCFEIRSPTGRVLRVRSFLLDTEPKLLAKLQQDRADLTLLEMSYLRQHGILLDAR